MQGDGLEIEGLKPGALHRLKVVELATNIVGPLAAQILGDMGADVIKVESPEGDQVRTIGPSRHPKMGAIFLGLNRNKRSLVLDLKSEEGKEAFLRLLGTADVFIHSLRPQAIQRLGFGYEQISKRFPRVIYASGPGYSSDGPYKDRAAYDDVIQGQSGVAGIIDRANGEVRYMPTVVADKLCAYILASSIGMAVYARTWTGRGQEVQVPMLENAVAFMLWEHMWGGAFDPPLGQIGYPRLLTRHRRPLKTLDGYICLMVVTDEQWERLFTTLERPDLMDAPRFKTIELRTAHIDELYKIVGECVMLRTTAEWQQRFNADDIPNSPMNRLEDLPKDPYLMETGFFEAYDHPTEGKLVRTPVTVHFSDTPASIRLPPPPIGAHSSVILKELGYEDSEIEKLMGWQVAG